MNSLNKNNTDVSIDFERVAKAVAQLCAASSANLGVDCYLHAHFAQVILKRLGVESELCIGEAAWRVGPGYNDVLSHLFSGFGHGPQVGFHCWLLVDGKIFDPTTYQIPMKIDELDAMDGLKTNVQFAPNFILDDAIAMVADWNKFLGILKAGTSYYKRLEDVEAKIKAGFTPDKEDEETAWMVYNMDASLVVGPNHQAA